MHTKNTKQKNAGYTLVETMVSITIFTIIVITGIGAVLNVNFLSNKSRDLRSIMDNLSFIMEEMSRNLRTGYNYHCGINGQQFGSFNDPKDCSNGYAIAFEEAHGDTTTDSDQWIYKIEGSPLKISKSINGGATFTDLNVPEIIIDPSSGFAVVGSNPASEPYNDENQPLVIIRLSGLINYQGKSTPFHLQTTVSQRLVDVK